MRRLFNAAKLFPSRALHRLSGVDLARFHSTTGDLALTFDDGPDPERTPRILDALAEAGVRATFFVVGEKAERHPALLDRMRREGHAIGNHSWSHRFLPALDERTLNAELQRTQLLIGNATLFRPPFGWGDPRVYAAAERLGLTTVLWSFDSFDYFGIPEAALALRLRAARSGDVVLLHDGSPYAHATPRVLSSFLRRALTEGVRFEAV